MFLSCVLLLCVLHVCGGTPDPDREMCYSRQHRDAAVNTRVALDQKGTVMVARAKPSEKDCILTCCSEDVGSGLKCNLVVYEPGHLNCQLFHCPSERACPLMTASAGVNTYNIFKGITHPTTKGRVTAKPTTTTTTTSTTTSTKPAPTTATSSSSSSTEPTESESPKMLETVAMTTAPATTATSTTKSTSTKAPHPPPRTPVKPNRPKRPSKPSRPETHSVKPTRVPTAPPTSSAPSTTTTTTTAALLELESGPKPKVSRVMWKNSLLAIVVITLVFLALILSLAARKAMESFDRRHYTRLELSELHYEL
ncbi:mucin-5AC-like [Sinocyclocheilus rhinocerous]|uniref:mucin-5AC-like n=1 Tax=Sinocyclocheilus rhinocerous TaxID=307959 RepID=UPI0007B9654F|nr:PREDICTED: mucin-5AC-like [Sinocyclocheilus rhinocerous]